MFVLLEQLRRARRTAALDRSGAIGSCALRHVDCGSCNACEHELTATLGPAYDLQRLGLDLVASPRHADVLLVTGPVTTRMVEPLRAAYAAMPEPRLVAALGDCPLGVGVVADRGALAGPLERILHVDIRIPGCPPTPAEITEALADALARRA
ncbi:MAG: hypothetical protein M9964_00885 [Solirubrobacterales bacterium]|nr:oxidoreductase [Acidobacteriota bacterium]MCB8970446.1 oxidoreductase [Thermoleophilales bacterium]MCO5325607.1 hypothetical protein [Solirubrobacterales bacterium]